MSNYAQAIYRLTVNGEDISSKLRPRLISLELTDNRGIEADTLDIRLSDHDGALALPPKGAELKLWLGWSDTGLVDKGKYIAAEIEHSGAPDVVGIRARSADLRKSLSKRQERSWPNVTLGNLVRSIAGAHGLTPVIAPALDNIQLPHIDQTNESDINLISRLAKDHDAICTVKAGHLLLMPTGSSQTASGLALPHISLTRADGDQHSYLDSGDDSCTGVKAYWYSPDSAERKEALVGTDDNAKTLRNSFGDEQSALQAVRAEWRRIQRGTASLRYQLALGRPDLIPELTYSLSGIKPEIEAIVWLGGNVRHSLSEQGLITSLELTSQLPEDETLTGDDSETATGVVAWYRDDATGKQAQVSAGDTSSPKRLTHLYASKSSATTAVKREWARMQV